MCRSPCGRSAQNRPVTGSRAFQQFRIWARQCSSGGVARAASATKAGKLALKAYHVGNAALRSVDMSCAIGKIFIAQTVKNRIGDLV